MLSHDVRARMALERIVMLRVVRDLMANDYILSLDNEENSTFSTPEAFVKEIQEYDDVYLLVQKREGNKLKRHGWVHFVMGNDGHDVVCDYTVNLEPIMKPINEWTDKLSPTWS